MQNLNQLLKTLLENKVDFVLIGGYAAVLYGSSQVTQDIDICAALTSESLDHLRKVLKPLNARHRMNPNHQPFLDEYPEPGKVLNNYYLITDQGTLDIIQEVTAVGSFEEVKKSAISIQLFGHTCRVISIDDLIKAKQSMNREKDQYIVKELLHFKSKK